MICINDGWGNRLRSASDRFGACFADPHSPWSLPFAPPPPPPVARLCSATSQLLWQSQTSPDRASAATAPRLAVADRLPRGAFGQPRPPGSRARSVRACQVLRPRRVTQALAMTLLSMLPSATQIASAPGITLLSRLDGWPARPPADASPTSSRISAHGSGSMRSLFLHRSGLAPPAPCRSPGAPV